MARILIVDDEPDIRFMMRLIFEGAGYKFTEARHGGLGLKSGDRRQCPFTETRDTAGAPARGRPCSSETMEPDVLHQEDVSGAPVHNPVTLQGVTIP